MCVCVCVCVCVCDLHVFPLLFSMCRDQQGPPEPRGLSVSLETKEMWVHLVKEVPRDHQDRL